MGSLVPLFLSVALLAAAQMGYGQGAPQLPWMLPVLATWPSFAAHMAGRAVRAGGLASVRRWILVTEASGIAAYFVLLFGCGWLDVVRRWTGDAMLPESWPGWPLGLALLPFIVFQLLAIRASVLAQGGTRQTQVHLRALQTRMFLAVVAPIGAFVGAATLVALFPWLRAQVEHVGLVWSLFMGLFVLLMAVSFPAVIRWAWDTAPFPDGPQRDLLDDVARRAEFEPSDLRIWRTGNLVANATIVGLTRRRRIVLFSDELLSILNSRELCAVYAHEIGHAARGHVGVFLAWTGGFFLLGDLAVMSFVDSGSILPAVAVGAAVTALWFVTFGWLSRRFELEADLFSLEVVRDLSALVSALERVGGLDQTRGGWRHFSVKRRVAFLARAASDRRFVSGFRRRLGVLSGVGFALAALGMALQAVELAGDLPRDRAVAALALSNYAAAEHHLESADEEAAEDLLPLVRVGDEARAAGSAGAALKAALSEDGRGLAELESLAQLAYLQAVPHAAQAADALEHAVDGELDDALEIAGSMDGELADLLDARLRR